MTSRLWASAPLTIGLIFGCSDDDSATTPTGGSGGSAGATSNAGSGGSAGSNSGGSSGSGGSAGSASMGGSAGSGGSSVGSAGSSADAGGDAGGGEALTFFVSSRGAGVNGGNLGGLEGADALCDELATAVGEGNRTWRAFLSTNDVDAKSRIGNGPWRGFGGLLIAESLTALFTDGIPQAGRNLADENGVVLPTNIHDVITGSDQDGTGLDNLNCNAWTSNDAGAQTVVGHSNGMGPQGVNTAFGWVRAHPAGNNTNCSQAGLAMGGGDGRIYCFAAD